MEVHFPPEQMKAIEGLAAQNGTSPDEEIRLIVADGLKRETNYDQWFREKVREGRAAAARGQWVSHEEAGRWLNHRFRG